MTDREGRLEYINPTFERLFGYPSNAILGQSINCLSVAEPDQIDPSEVLAIVRAAGSWQGETYRRAADGRGLPVRISVIRRDDAEGHLTGFVSTFVDLGETRRREAQLKALHNVALDLSGRLDLDDLVQHALASARRLTETDFAALAVLTPDRAGLYYRWLSPVGDPALRDALREPFVLNATVAGQALRDGQPLRIDADSACPRMLEAFRLLGLASGLIYPVNTRGSDPAILLVASLDRAHRFAPEEIQLVETIAHQIAVAMERERLIAEARVSSQRLDQIIENNADAILVTDDAGRVKFANPAAQRLLNRDAGELNDFPLGLTSQSGTGELAVHRAEGDCIEVELHAMETTWDSQRAHVLTLRDVTDRRLVEQERRLGADRIRTALVQTIEAISRTVETRDPYTAGHQRRVAALGRAIARELGLDQGTIDGVYMGGMIHDIGKLYIPSEILNRPGQLAEVEFMLIKTHCSVGRDIIGGIAFPWPLAAMIHQHHERIDGNGYPQGLRGDCILLEARILAVADVVDAMSSRRPYREALGLGAALDELTRGRGTRYQPDAADACVRLFREQGLTLDQLESLDARMIDPLG